MTGISIAARYAMAGAMFLMPVTGASAEEAFQTFKQLSSTSKMPKLSAFSATGGGLATAAAKDVAFRAKLVNSEEMLKEGLIWRVFSPISGEDGKLPLVASSEGGDASFQLLPGDYFVNVAFGRAGVTKKLTVPTDGDVGPQVLVLDAGGVVLDAVSGSDAPVPASRLRFSIYSSEVREDGERGLVMADVRPDTIVRLNAGAYASEIIRAGLLGVDRGQYEAAKAIGMTGSLALRRIVLPQAMRTVLPPLGNEFISMIKMTSLASIIGFSDLLRSVQNIYFLNTRVIELLMVATVWYLVVVTALSFVQRILERRFGRGFMRSTQR